MLKGFFDNLKPDEYPMFASYFKETVLALQGKYESGQGNQVLIKIIQDTNKTATQKMIDFVGDLTGPKRLLDTLE